MCENTVFIVIFTRVRHWCLIGVRRTQPTPLHAPSYHLQPNLILPNSLFSKFLFFRFSDLNFVCFSHIFHTCCMSHLLYPYHPNTVFDEAYKLRIAS
jgi:hypothetical protein